MLFRSGVCYTNSHSTFPTETRVNQSAVITGCYPASHGIVANQFIDPVASPGAVFNTGDEDELKAAFERLNGQVLHKPTVGPRLSRSAERRVGNGCRQDRESDVHGKGVDQNVGPGGGNGVAHRPKQRGIGEEPNAEGESGGEVHDGHGQQHS